MTTPQQFEQPVIPEGSKGVYEFCPAVRLKPAGRCVAAIGHAAIGNPTAPAGGHDFQPLTSVTVRAIERQEFPYERLGHDRPYYASQRKTEAVVDAAAAAAPLTTGNATDMGEVSA